MVRPADQSVRLRLDRQLGVAVEEADRLVVAYGGGQVREEGRVDRPRLDVGRGVGRTDVGVVEQCPDPAAKGSGRTCSSLASASVLVSSIPGTALTTPGPTATATASSSLINSGGSRP
jgi:hypothetical protein